MTAQPSRKHNKELVLINYVEPVETGKRKRVRWDSELVKHYETHGKIDADVFYSEISKADHPLHNDLIWDDRIAAERYRKAQIYAMIISSKVIAQIKSDNGKPVIVSSDKVRRLVSAYRGDGFYVREDALSDSERREKIISGKKSALRSWCHSVVDIEELKELREMILQKI